MPRRRQTQPIRTTSSEIQGSRAQQERRQQQIPLPQTRQAPTVPPANIGNVSIPPSIDSPSTRPNEPITTGLSTGPGAGPEALGPAGIPAQPDVDLATLKMIFSRVPDDGLAEIISRMEANAGVFT